MKPRPLIAFSTGLVLALAAGWLGLPHLLYARAEQPLRFSHKTHTSDKTGFACEDCHPVREDGSFAGIPALDNCATCHSEPLGASAEEKRLVDDYVQPGREIPWLVYSRQPENVHFPHAVHVKRAAIACQRCHGRHGETDTLRPYQQNRLSGYSRDIWGPSLARIGNPEGQGMKMSDCVACHEASGRAHTSCLACHR